MLSGAPIFLFGGVDTNQHRFNDVLSFEIEHRKWTRLDCKGEMPQPRTFHRSVIFDSVMYIFGGFDGQRLNDMYQVRLHQPENPQIVRKRSHRPFSSVSDSFSEPNSFKESRLTSNSSADESFESAQKSDDLQAERARMQKKIRRL